MAHLESLPRWQASTHQDGIIMSTVHYHRPDTSEPITFSESAKAHIAKQMEKKAGALGFRLCVNKAGCSGLMYNVGYVINEVPTDLVFELDRTLTVYIDINSYPFIKGTHVDLKKQGINEVLVYQNPNAKGQCGCGESFIVDDAGAGDA